SEYQFPHISPDGTRLAMLAYDPKLAGATTPQVFAARLNMNNPPVLSQIGSQGTVDSTVHVSISCAQGLESTITIEGDDADTDSGDLTYSAAFLKDGMTFDGPTSTLTWTPSVAIGTAYNVKFMVTTPNGGTDAIIATLTVTNPNLL